MMMGGTKLMQQSYVDNFLCQWQVKGNSNCRVLKFMINFHSPTASAAISFAFFGQGTGTIALNNVQCVGTEARLVDCSSGSVVSCSHSEDAGVRCQEQRGSKFWI